VYGSVAEEVYTRLWLAAMIKDVSGSFLLQVITCSLQSAIGQTVSICNLKAFKKVIIF